MAVVLVIGSEGSLGKPLTKELIKRGHNVFTADILHAPNKNHTRCDIRQFRQLSRLFEKKYDYVYNLAAEFGRKNGEDFYENLWMTNVVGLKNILSLQKVKKFKLIHFSSSEIYGEPKLASEEFMREALSKELSLKQTNDYAITKWVNELQIRNAIARNNTETFVIRLFNAYGPGEYYHPYRSVVCLFIYRALFDMPYQVFLNYHRVFMYVDDCIRTLGNIIDHFKSGEVYNIGGEEYTDVKKVSDMILEILGKDDSKITYLPEDQHNVVNKRPDINRAKEDLGHVCKVKLKEGIPKTVEWMKTVYLGKTG